MQKSVIVFFYKFEFSFLWNLCFIICDVGCAYDFSHISGFFLLNPLKRVLFSQKRKKSSSSYISPIFYRKILYKYDFCRILHFPLYCCNDRYTKSGIEIRTDVCFLFGNWLREFFQLVLTTFFLSLKKNSVCGGYRPAATNTNQEIRTTTTYFCGNTFNVKYS